MSKRILRPTSMTQIFDEAFDLYKRNFWLFMAICAVVDLPSQLLWSINGFPAFDSVMWSVMMLGSVIRSLSAAAMVHTVSHCFLGRSVGFVSAYSHVWRVVPVLFATGLVVSIWTYLGLFLLVVPGLIFASWGMVLTPIVILEGKSFASAIRRAKQLASGQYGRILKVLLLTVLVWACQMLVTHLAGRLMYGRYPKVVTWPATPELMLISTVMSQLMAPISGLLTTLVYYDIRVRKEGFDIEMLARDMSGEHGQRAAKKVRA